VKLNHNNIIHKNYVKGKINLEAKTIKLLEVNISENCGFEKEKSVLGHKMHQQ
jgi:hypothetical protein